VNETVWLELKNFVTTLAQEPISWQHRAGQELDLWSRRDAEDFKRCWQRGVHLYVGEAGLEPLPEGPKVNELSGRQRLELD
jgi:hypothetical protein